MSRALRALLVLIAIAALMAVFTTEPNDEPDTVKVRVSKELGNPAETGW